MQKKEKNSELIGVIIAITVMVILSGLTVCFAKWYAWDEESTEMSEGNLTSSEVKETVNVWYYDDKLTAYVEDTAAKFEKQYGVNVKYSLIPKENYLEGVNICNINNQGKPAVYLMDSTYMEKAVLAGLTTQNLDVAKYNNDNYATTALAAATYKGAMYAYPVNFDTSVMAYNTAYVSVPPQTFDDIINYSNNLNESISGKLENILVWDVKDLMYNYGFIGSNISYGAENGDDAAVKSFTDEKAIASMQYYRNLNQIFSIDINSMTYDNVLEKFGQGKAAFAMISTDGLKRLNEMENPVSYQIEKIPDINTEITTTGLATTTVAVVNPCTSNVPLAQLFAEFISYENASSSYDTCGLLAGRKNIKYSDVNMDVFMAEYEKSVNLPKLMEAGGFGAKLETVMNQIWQGADPQEMLNSLGQ